jgi:hypothetical protein
MERLQIDELILAHWRVNGGNKLTYAEVGEAVFKGERTRPKRPKTTTSPMNEKRKQALIGQWNRGFGMSALRPRHIARLAAFFKVNEIDKLVSTNS